MKVQMLAMLCTPMPEEQIVSNQMNGTEKADTKKRNQSHGQTRDRVHGLGIRYCKLDRDSEGSDEV